jgi:hypothetical protein
MSGDLKKRSNKRTIVVEDIENGAVRITVAGPPYLITTGADSTRNMSTRDIAEVWLSDFAHKGEDRAAYSAKHCTDTGVLHGPEGCDGTCHELNCSKPADFLEHWKTDDGQERCLPFCKWHSHDMNHCVGRAVLWALDYGVVDDLRFWKEQDPLPGGRPRCDHCYYAIDPSGDSERARCAVPATKRVKVSENSGGEPSTYEAKLCTRCAAAPVTGGQKIEILGDLEIPPAEHCEE